MALNMKAKFFRSQLFIRAASYASYDAAVSPIHTFSLVILVPAVIYTLFNEQEGLASPVNLIGVLSIVAAIFIGLVSPILGGMADRRGRSKKWLFAFNIMIIVVSTIIIFYLLFQESSQLSIWLFVPIVLLITFVLEFSSVFFNSLLSSAGRRSQLGKVSGFAFGAGYIATIVSLLIVFGYITLTGNVSLTDLFDAADDGFTVDFGLLVTATIFLIIWFIIFAIPMYLKVPGGRVKSSTKGSLNPFIIIKDGIKVARTVPTLGSFLLARLFYNDGLITFIQFGYLYSTTVHGLSFTTFILFVAIFNISSGFGAFIMGILDDKIGSVKTIYISLVICLILITCLTFTPFIIKDSSLYYHIGFGVGIGFFVGPLQSSSRSHVAKIIPPQHEAQIFGFYALSGKVTSFAGALIYAAFANISPEYGPISIILLWVIGLVLLSFVLRKTMKNDPIKLAYLGEQARSD